MVNQPLLQPKGEKESQTCAKIVLISKEQIAREKRMRKDEIEMDKRIFLIYTKLGTDRLRHSYHAWFEDEGQLQGFIEKQKGEAPGFEIDLSIEILNYRPLLAPAT